jgi:hypothetical protein
MTSNPVSTVPPARRRLLAVAVTVAAAAASAASNLPTPQASYPGVSPTQTTVLGAAAPTFTSTVQVAVQDVDTSGVELAVQATVTWTGDAGAPPVTAALGPDQGPQIGTDPAPPPGDAGLAFASPGLGTITVAAGQVCTDVDPPCLLDFTLVLAEVPAAEEVTVTWTAVATIETRATQEPAISVTVIP